MAKQDFKPLFPPGIQKLTRQQFEDVAVKSFQDDQRRVQNFALLCLWIDRVQALGGTGILWLDGSFVTEKPSPDDIDCIVWNFDVPNLTQDPTARMRIINELNILFDRTVAETQYNLDLYIGSYDPNVDGDQFQKQSYWKGVFGFQHDGVSAKGFVELTI